MCSLNIHGFPLQWSNSKNPGKNAGENAKYIVFRGETIGQVHLNSFRAIKFNCVFSFGWWINWWVFWAYSFPAPVLQRTFVRGRGHFMFPMRLRVQPHHFFTYCWPTNSGQPIRMVQTWMNSWCIPYHVVGKMLFINSTLFCLFWLEKNDIFPNTSSLFRQSDLVHQPLSSSTSCPYLCSFASCKAVSNGAGNAKLTAGTVAPVTVDFTGLHRRILSNLKCPCTFDGARSYNFGNPYLVGGFNPLEKYLSNQVISPCRGEKKNWNHHPVIYFVGIQVDMMIQPYQSHKTIARKKKT